MLKPPLKALKTHFLALCVALAACSAERGEQKPGEGGQEKVEDPAPTKRVATAPANGWGEQIAWRALDDALPEAKKERMPVMVVIHTAWCSKCKALKQSSFSDPQLRELSEEFVMVNVDQDVEPKAGDLAPDGMYIPRVVFLDPDGKVDEDLKNPRPSRYKYFYLPQDDLLATMRKALERHGKSS
jgi:protein-disulfide reductase (glutathione)